MNTSTQASILSVKILVGKHSVVIPNGTAELIAKKLEAAGFREGTWKVFLSDFVKGTPNTPDFRVRGLEDHSITIRVHPGGNDSCTQLRLVVPRSYDPQQVHDALAQLSVPVETVSANMDSAESLAESEAESIQPVECTIEEIITDRDLTDFLLYVLYCNYPQTFSKAGLESCAILHLDVRMPILESRQLDIFLREQRLIEPAPHEESIGYRLTRIALERIGAKSCTSSSDELALNAALRISQLREDADGYLALEQRKCELEAELEDLKRRMTALEIQAREVRDSLNNHPGKEAAKNWKVAQQLLNIPE